jgi:RNA polymerase sigma-70 factor (sigma-E family)
VTLAVVDEQHHPPTDLDAFVRSSGDRLLRAAVLLSGRHEGAEDLTQAVLERVARRWDTLENPQAYAMKTLTNLIRDGWRRGQVARPLRLVQPPEQDSSENQALRRLLVPQLGRLPAKQRKVVVLRYLLDMSERQTADLMNISTGSVKSQASRGLARLREMLEETAGVDDV